MSYDDRESSAFAGQPFFVYEFTRGSEAYRYTSRARDIDAFSETFSASSISHGKITASNKISRDALDVWLPSSDQFAQTLVGIRAPQRTRVTIWRGHESESDFRVIYKGRVQSGKPDGSRIRLVCSSVFTTLQNPGLAPKFTRNCRHVLYGRACGVDQASFARSASATAISGLTVSVTEAAPEADGYFVGGIIDFNGSLGFILGHANGSIATRAEVNGLRDAIQAHTADPSGVPAPAVTLYPGCDRTNNVCSGKFSNSDNFGGLRFMPVKNPFSGSSIV